MSTQTGGRRRMERGLIQGQAPPAMLGHSQTPTWDTPGRPRNRREMTVMASPGSCGSTWGSVGWLGRRVCTGPPEQSVNIKHLGSPHGGPWPLGTHRPEGRPRYKGCLLRWLMTALGGCFSSQCRGEPLAPRNPFISLEGSSLPTHPRLLSRHGVLKSRR